MCCLKNEAETYEYLNSHLPSVGEFVTAYDGTKGEVESVNVLRQKVKLLVEKGDDKELVEYPVSELKFKPKRHKVSVTAEEIKELASLEDKEGSSKLQ